MVLLTRGAPVLLEIGLLVFCLIDCLQTPREAVRSLSRRIWVIVIVLVPLAGGIAWLVLGRPRRADREAALRGVGGPGTASGPTRVRPARRAAPLAPDDDPEFLARLARDLARPADPEAGSEPTPPAAPRGTAPGGGAAPERSDSPASPADGTGTGDDDRDGGGDAARRA